MTGGTTFASASAASAARWSVVITLEGSGNAAGLFYYCSSVPDFAAADANYRPWLREDSWPDIMSESVSPNGGMPEPGNILLDLIDIENSLTAEWRTERGPTAILDGAITKDATSASVIDASAITAGDVVYLSNEAVLVGGVSVNTLTGLTRGVLDTDAIKHTDQEEVYASTPFLRGRRMRVYLIPSDAPSAAELTPFGVYHVDSLALAPDFNGYRLQGRSALKYLDRMITHGVDTDGFISMAFPVSAGNVRPRLFISKPAEHDLFSDGEAFLKVGEEIINAVVTNSALNVTFEVKDRGVLGTEAGAEALTAGAAAVFVLAADTTAGGPGAFRFIRGADWAQLSVSEKAGINRVNHLWQRSAHWVDLILCLLTSSAGDDDLELVNASDDWGNWSCLPSGYGLGLPASLIDFESFIEIKNSTPDFLFQNFYIGAEAQPVKEVITTQLLEPIGAYVTTESGQVTLRMPTIPLKDEVLTAWGDAVLLSRPGAGNMQRGAELTLSQDASNVATTVNFIVKTQSGGEATHTFNDTSFEGWSVGRSYYARGEEPITFEIPAIRAEGSESFLRRLGMRKLFRFRRPIWNIETRTGIDQHSVLPGALVGLTNDELPDTATGLRGWSDVACEVVSRELAVNEDAAGFSFGLLAFTESRIGRVSASGYILGTSGPDGSGDFTLDLADNVYTDSQSLGLLPTLDADAFRAGDVVTLANLDGSDAASTTTQIVQSVTGSQAVIDGNFGGALTAGAVLVFSDRAASVTAQHDFFVYFAATTDSPPNIGASTDKPWRFGE